jgi:hypothetical protein
MLCTQTHFPILLILLTDRAFSFWAIGIPLVAVVTLVFMWGDVRDAVHFMQKRYAERHDSDMVRVITLDFVMSSLTRLQATAHKRH